MTRRHVGIGLVVAALLFAGAASFAWQSANDQAEKDQLAEEYRAAINGNGTDDIEPSHGASYGLGALAAVLFLGGVIVLVSPSPDS